jgi:hypothetical protein
MPGLVPKSLGIKLNTSYISPKCKKVLYMPVSLSILPSTASFPLFRFLSLCSSHKIHIVLEVTIDIVHYLGFDKSSIIYIYHYSSKPHNFTFLKLLYVPLPSIFPHESLEATDTLFCLWFYIF